MRHERRSPGRARDHCGIRDPAEAGAADWITLWQSELAALAADREAQETWQAMLALWAGAAGGHAGLPRRAMPGA